MTERFTITGDRSISDHQKKRLYDLSDFHGVISVTECLNELHEENQQVKDILKEYDNLDCFVDSAMATEFIERIALAVGMELEE